MSSVETFTVYETEAAVHFILIKSSLLFLCKFLLIRMRTTSLTQEKQRGLNYNKVNSSLNAILRPGH